MRKIIITSLIIMFLKTICFSQNISTIINQDTTVTITSEQLKYSNFIFIEHNRLLIRDSLLTNQINNLQLKILLLEKNDSLKTIKIKNHELLNNNYNIQINNLNKIIKHKDNTIKVLKIGGITIGCGILILLLLK